MDELHQRAAAQAAAAVGLSPSAAMAAMPLLPDMKNDAEAAFAMSTMPPMVRFRTDQYPSRYTALSVASFATCLSDL